MEQDKIAIVIQGGSNNVVEQKKAWKGFNIIFSTWTNDIFKYNEEDIVVLNDLPGNSGPANFNYQIQSTLAGLYKAKELGYKHILKLRSDLIPTNAENFISLLQPNKFNFLCWHEHEVYPNCEGYLVDYLMSGPIDDLIKMWEITDFFCVVPEVILTWNYIKNASNVEINYFLNDLNSENDLYWIKNNKCLSTYQASLQYDKYKKFTFSNKQLYLTEKYLSFFNK